MSESTDKIHRIERPGMIKRSTPKVADLAHGDKPYTFDLEAKTFQLPGGELTGVEKALVEVWYADLPNEKGTMLMLKHPDEQNRPRTVVGVMVAPRDSDGTRPEVDGVWVADEGDGDDG